MPAPDIEQALSPREREIVELLASGCTATADIAERLSISPHTVHWALGEIRRKLDVSDRVQIVAWAFRQRSSSSAGNAWSVFLQAVEPSGA